MSTFVADYKRERSAIDAALGGLPHPLKDLPRVFLMQLCDGFAVKLRDSLTGNEKGLAIRKACNQEYNLLKNRLRSTLPLFDLLDGQPRPTAQLNPQARNDSVPVNNADQSKSIISSLADV
jgi:hypothetical protein